MCIRDRLIEAGAPRRPAETVIHTRDFTSTPRQRVIGWVMMAIAPLVTLSLTGTLWPGLAEQLGFSDRLKGLGLFLLILPIPLGQMLWAKLRRHMARPWIMLSLLPIGAAACVCLSQVQSFAAAVTCLMCVGLVHSCVAFCGIYYANADPLTPGRSIAINETLAASAATVGPLVLGSLAWDDYRALPPYVFGGATLMVGFVIVLLIWLRRPRDAAGAPLKASVPAAGHGH